MQPSWPHTWSMTHISDLTGALDNFAMVNMNMKYSSHFQKLENFESNLSF